MAKLSHMRQLIHVAAKCNSQALCTCLLIENIDLTLKYKTIKLSHLLTADVKIDEVGDIAYLAEICAINNNAT